MQSKRIRIFTDKYPFLGPLVWLLSIQYFINQVIVAGAWAFPCSASRNTISDLGATICGTISGRAVCSPLHAIMNSSFIALGMTMALGSVLIYHEFRDRLSTATGFTALGLAGIGTIIVGLVPENVNIGLHMFGASLPFLIGNLGILLLGISLVLKPGLKIYTILTGAVSLIALFLFTLGMNLGLGVGGMERVAAYPQTIWLMVFGYYMSRNRYELVRAQRTVR